MSDKVDLTEVKRLHSVGFRGVLSIVFKHKTFRKWPFVTSVIISFMCCVFIASTLSDDKSYKILTETTDLITIIFPSLLGFSLGGYAIVVGFSNVDLIKNATNSTKHNVYQILNGIFALSILIQAVAVIMGFIISWCIKVDVTSLLIEQQNINLSGWINIVLLFFLFLVSIYSLLLIPFVITNLFTLSQLNSLHYTIVKIAEDKAASELAKKQASEE